MMSMGTTFALISTVGSIGMIPIMSTPTPTPTTTMFPGPVTTPGGAFTPYPSSLAQFAADPANAQALQGYQQVMAMMQHAGGFMPFAYPGMIPPIMSPMAPPVSTPSTFVPRMVPIRLVNLTRTMNEAAPSNVHEVDEEEQEVARRRKGKAIAKPSKTRDSAFKCLGDKEDGPHKSAKLRLGPEMGRTSVMERLGGGRPTQSRRSRESETIHLDEEEAESQPKASAYTRLSYDEDDLDKIGSVARKLRALEEKNKRELEEGYTKVKTDKPKKDDQMGGSKPRATYDGSVHQIRDEKKGEQPKRPWIEKWCTYHQSDSHNTADCQNVKVVLKEMALKGELGEGYATGHKKDPKANTWTRPQEKDQGRRKGKDNNKPDKEFIKMIVSGPEGRDTTSQRKNWARSLHVSVVSVESHGKQARREPITFTDRDLPRTGGDHNDPLVITMDINGADVARVLVDTGSSVNVLYLDAFKKLKLDRSMLRPLQTPLSSFTGASIEAEGQITLPVTLGSGNRTVTKQMRFLVVDIKCVHNAILGRPKINQVRAIISMAHLCMKFYTSNGIGEERGDQKNARSCYLEAVKKMTRQFEQIELVSQHVDKGEEKAKIEPDANTEEIQVDASNPERKVRIGADLQEESRTEIVEVLTRYKSLFAWSVADMPGINRSVICHRFSVLEGSRPVRQKKRFLASERRDFVKKEVKDLLEEEEPAREITESWWSMSVDGASGPKGYEGGIVFTTPEGFKVYHALIFSFKLTNNEAEYEALIGGLRLAKTLQITCLRIKSDSSLVVGHINGNMEDKGEKMQRYRDLARALLKDLTEYVIEQIPRGENTDADLLSKLTQEAPEHVSKLARIETLEKASIEGFSVSLIEEDGQPNPDQVEPDGVWMDDLVKYYMTGQFSEDEDRVRKVKLRVPRFQMLDGRLYKRAFGGPVLRCLTRAEAERVIAEVHEGVCAAHQMSRTLAQRIILLGYSWPTMNQDCEKYVQRCKTCQVFYKFPEMPATYYHPVSNVIPFSRFGMDIIGAFPQAQGRKKYVMVPIDYFTKWVEAEAYATITTKQCQRFVWKNIITRFGSPRNIVTDNGPQFRYPGFRKYLEDFGITHNKASVAYPQGNGQVENANRTIVDGIKKRLGEAGTNWLEELPHIIWAYRVTSRRATGETPFILTYGCEARLPIEAKIMTFEEKIYEEKGNEKNHLAELNLLEERRMVIKAKMIEYQQAAKAYHNNRVGPRYFQVGDEVLRRMEASKPGDGGKLTKKWEGPYRVTTILRPGTYKLETMEGRELERCWNSHHLRKFYR
ncbi:unnamed protein product [Cuscuta campestris]|uniref:Uncharacterized protein n=1 Tax=Cuscuta campestris TaxID=132261 RepID=A0A484NKV3_9ASTE|nr:unnamed protein product [Cuscuta campestris]